MLSILTGPKGQWSSEQEGGVPANGNSLRAYYPVQTHFHEVRGLLDIAFAIIFELYGVVSVPQLKLSRICAESNEDHR
jgi:hypothetical protein